jgi:hypothetical protein
VKNFPSFFQFSVENLDVDPTTGKQKLLPLLFQVNGKIPFLSVCKLWP